MEQETGGEMTTLQGAFIESETELYPPQTGSRPYLSTHYLHGARHMVAMAKEAEENPDKVKPPDGKHRTYVVSAIMLVANFLEAAINEVYGDAADGHTSYISSLSKNHIAALRCYWESTEAKNIYVQTLPKYQAALIFGGIETFKTDESPYQEASALVILRNSLIHFKPRTYTLPDQHKLNKTLRSYIGTKRNGVVKYPLNPFAKGDKGTMALDRILGHGTTVWALDSAIAFTDEYFKRLKITPNYQQVDFPYASDNH